MLNAFDLIPKEARPEHRRAYRQYLGKRDGELDVVNRKLTRRELSIGRFESAQQKQEMDASVFRAQYDKFDKKRDVSEEMLLLLALVKMNGAEAYGVNYSFEGLLKRVQEEQSDDSELYLLIEEHYHTRILLSTAREFGLEVQETYRPGFSLRTLIATIAAVPAALARPLTLASEVYGVTLFSGLLKRTGEVLRDLPVLRDAVEERLIEVLTDEIGHVTFNRLGLSSWGLAQAQMIMPMVQRGLGDFVPELRALGIDTFVSDKTMAQLPNEVRKNAFVV